MGKHRRRRHNRRGQPGRISFRNSEQYADPTAYLALTGIQREERMAKRARNTSKTSNTNSAATEQYPAIRVEHYPPRSASKA